MSTVSHAERELRLAGFYDKDSDYGGMLPEAVLALMKVFADQGHSGGSAPIVANLFRRLALFECISPLTGADDEWNDISDVDGGHFQNNRVSHVFKEKATGRAYDIDAITWRTQTGSTWTGSAKMKDGRKIKSRQFIKSFPFTPRNFVVDVIEEEIAKDDWVFTVKDEAQLQAVGEHYDLTIEA